MVEQRIVDKNPEPAAEVPAIKGEEVEAPPKDARMEMRIPIAAHERIRKLADYAALEGLITEDHRGNITGFLNWCIGLGEGVLQNHAMKRKGFK